MGVSEIPFYSHCDIRDLLRIDERSADSYIVRDDFFKGKVLKFVQDQFYFLKV